MVEIFDVKKEVQDYYGKTLQASTDLKTNACCLGSDPGYTEQEADALAKVHPEIVKKFYGCGSPIPQGIYGKTVVDLGCGTGRDCFLASAMVGQEGHVIGVDMTDEQLAVANAHIEYHRQVFGYEKANTEFRKGVIEDLKGSAGIADESVDVVISNCVINLSSDKEKVFREIWRVLRPGGELYFSDVYSDRRIPKHLRDDKLLWGECLSGALYIEDFRRMMTRVGFNYYYTVKQSNITVNNKALEAQCGDIKFYSITVRAYKIPELEDRCEDYGEEAIYKGTLAPGLEKSFKFDRSHEFKTGEKLHICRNFALVLTKCPLFKGHFEVTHSEKHLGLFETAPGVCGC